MNRLSYITCLLLTLSLLQVSCKKDVLIIPFNPLTSIIDHSGIRDLAVNQNQIVYSNFKSELIVMDRNLNETKYYHKFNSHVLEVFKIQKNGTGKIHIGDRKSGIYYYENDTAKFTVTGSNLRDFDYQRQVCFRNSESIFLVDKTGTTKQWPSLQFRQKQGGAKTQMFAMDDTVWIGASSGLYSMDVNEPTPRSISNDYQGGNLVVQLKIDSNDNIWFLTNTALSYRIKGKWAVTKLPPSITPTDLVVHNDTVYISSDYGIYRFIENRFELLKEVNDNLRHQYVTCLELEGNHTLWIGTGAGIYTYPLR